MSQSGNGDNTMDKGKFRFAIDRGGTFTDIWAKCPDGSTHVLKLLSEDPVNYRDAPTEGIRRIMEQATGSEMPKTTLIESSQIEWIRMGTTVATNALLERKGERLALLVTSGFKGVLHIGNQSRPQLFDLKITTPELLYEDVVEVTERIVLKQDKCQLKKMCPVETGITGEQVEIWQRVDKEKLREDLQKLLAKGIRSLAVVFLHSYTYPRHEEEVGELALELGFTHVSLSSKAMPMVKVVPRGFTACADAYLTPCIKKYVKNFTAGFKHLEKTNLLFMQSDGGLTPMHKFNGSRAILSGPAGGVVGYAMTSYEKETGQPVIGFDMGGTSTDVSRFAGNYEHVFETTTAGVTIQAPQWLPGADHSSSSDQGCLWWALSLLGLILVPVCYKKGGPLAVTDANLVLGRLIPDYFPHIFGETEDQPLDLAQATAAFTTLTQQVNEFTRSQTEGDPRKPPLTMEQVAMGFIQVANETMCRPIRSLTQGRGHDTSRHALTCFGGAGGQHACAIARSLGIKTVFIHKYAGIMSAYGMALADVVHEAQQPCALKYQKDSFPLLDDMISALTNECIQELQQEGFNRSQISVEPFLHMRYEGTDCALMISAKDRNATGSGCRHGNFEDAFLERYLCDFGFVIPGRAIVVDDVRVRGIGQTHISMSDCVQQSDTQPQPEQERDVYFDGAYQKSKVYLLERLCAGHTLQGPAIIIDKNSTILVESNCQAEITSSGNIKMTIASVHVSDVGCELDMIQLSIFSHRFMSIAEQMGRVLQKTAISTNIKERLDFSCALFGPDGGLVANAPHIPVHLGAMQETVQYQIRKQGKNILPGDVLLSNHPCAGGSHLPDLTVITPVFHQGVDRPVFFVASRGHHSEIGGTTPGSMPPHSKSIFEEGAVFISFFLVKQGKWEEDELIAALEAPGKYPGSCGSRNINDNLSDLKAQVAANQKGIHLVEELICEYSLPVVQAYMDHIQNNAEMAVREMLKEIAQERRQETGVASLVAHDYMDDGTQISLNISLDESQGSAIFEFSGSGYEVYGNCNTPRAVTLSAIIYSLRCMVGHDIPLNQGCLAPVKVNIPKGSILDPSDTAAVVGGNVLTSQRIVDVVFKAFSACAASQGCTNSVTFGDDNFGYYETVAGGAGAGPTWQGQSGIHTHMTNTRMTDPEIVERRYPVIVQRFSLRPGSGGKGRYCGGDGVVREILFRKPLVLCILTERRVFQPYGLKGGQPGKTGQNLLIHPDGRSIYLGSKASVLVEPGDVFQLMTPGGGGFGEVNTIVSV
ncbi:5-oxoprolinase [Lamellibrachia satsuma]|nr:5-oxoprolinase [Lamellibrachia satsuma]